MNIDIKQMTTELLEKHLIQTITYKQAHQDFFKIIEETYIKTMQFYSKKIEAIEQELKNRGQ